MNLSMQHRPESGESHANNCTGNLECTKMLDYVRNQNCLGTGQRYKHTISLRISQHHLSQHFRAPKQTS